MSFLPSSNKRSFNIIDHEDGSLKMIKFLNLKWEETQQVMKDILPASSRQHMDGEEQKAIVCMEVSKPPVIP